MGIIPKPEQIIQNVKAVDILPKLTAEIMKKIEDILANKPAPLVSARFCGPLW